MTEVLVAVFGLLGLAITGIFSYLAAKNSREANIAVNHSVAPSAKRIYQLASENHTNIKTMAIQLQELRGKLSSGCPLLDEQKEKRDGP